MILARGYAFAQLTFKLRMDILGKVALFRLQLNRWVPNFPTPYHKKRSKQLGWKKK